MMEGIRINFSCGFNSQWVCRHPPATPGAGTPEATTLGFPSSSAPMLLVQRVSGPDHLIGLSSVDLVSGDGADLGYSWTRHPTCQSPPPVFRQVTHLHDPRRRSHVSVLRSSLSHYFSSKLLLTYVSEGRGWIEPPLVLRHKVTSPQPNYCPTTSKIQPDYSLTIAQLQPEYSPATAKLKANYSPTMAQLQPDYSQATTQV